MTHRRMTGGTVNYTPASGVPQDADLVCFSHLRWEFVFQRPQHLMTRFARRRRVLFFEEPLPTDGEAFIEAQERDGVTVARARVPRSPTPGLEHSLLPGLVQAYVNEWVSGRWIAWYYTPMALEFTGELRPSLVVYDCMDELSAFRGAPPALLHRESELLQKANVVFTGGPSLYEAKRNRHPFVLSVPSSIDVHHFRPARDGLPEPPDQESIGGPRLGFCGVLDERFDADLIGEAASARPEWSFVLIGPVAKIEASALPQAANIHYLGQRRYDELPAYLSGWDVALMPFALNESTRYISPTKTPEYLAAGRRVVSTPIADVVRMYGSRGLVEIADGAEDFISAIERALAPRSVEEDREWLSQVDSVLSRMSWDRTWMGMEEAMELAAGRVRPSTVRIPAAAATRGTNAAAGLREASDV